MTKLDDALQEYSKITKNSRQNASYLFFHQVDLADDWERTINQALRDGSRVCFSVSSEKALAKSSLRGTLRQIKLGTDNFFDYLAQESLEISNKAFYMAESYFADFLLRNSGQDLQRLQLGLYKNVVAPAGIKNPRLVEQLFARLMENRRELVSINSLAKEFGFSVDTCKRYVDEFISANLILAIDPWRNPGVKKSGNVVKKYFAADLAYRRLYQADLQALLENYLVLLFADRELQFIGGVNLDYLLIDGKILIAPSFQQELSGSERKVFERFSFKEKFVIKGISDLQLLADRNVF